jgi:[calcium/calmodulin-dependent protein kinase] kinase
VCHLITPVTHVCRPDCIHLLQGSYGIVKLAYNEQDKNLYVSLHMPVLDTCLQAMKVLDKVKLTKKFACFRQPPTRRSKHSGRIISAKDPLAQVCTRTRVSTLPPVLQVHREIAILKKLNHPNVVKLVEVLNDPSDTFLYMGECAHGCM